VTHDSSHPHPGEGRRWSPPATHPHRGATRDDRAPADHRRFRVRTRARTTGDDASGTAAAAPSPIPTADLDRVHAALHDIGERCYPQPSTDPASREALDADAAVITSFAARYPDIRFNIDDESGTALSLLLAARDDLTGCRPGAAAVIDAALPAAYRSTQPGPTPATR
jgi:hypothetical protein